MIEYGIKRNINTLPPSPIEANFRESLIKAENYGDIYNAVKQYIHVLRQGGIKKIGFASGSLGNGVNSMYQDMQKMLEWSKKLEEKNSMPILSSAYIFTYAWNNLSETKAVEEGTLSKEDRSEKLKKLFRGILLIPHGINNIFMLPTNPGWRKAPGSVDEYETGLTIDDMTIYELDADGKEVLMKLASK